MTKELKNSNARADQYDVTGRIVMFCVITMIIVLMILFFFDMQDGDAAALAWFTMGWISLVLPAACVWRHLRLRRYVKNIPSETSKKFRLQYPRNYILENVVENYFVADIFSFLFM